jgi:hypothetical protein
MNQFLIYAATLINLYCISRISTLQRQIDILADFILQLNTKSNTLIDVWAEHKAEHLK